MQKLRMIRLFLWLCLILILSTVFAIFPLGEVSAAPKSIQLQVEPGWNGQYKGDFVPVRVQVKNSGNDVSGEISIKPANKQLTPQENYSSFPAEKIQLPAGATKEVTLIVPKYLARPDFFVVFNMNQEEVAKHLIGGRRLGQTDLTIGILSDDPNVASKWNESIREVKGFKPHTYPLKVKDIPAQSQGLSGLDILIINRLTAESLSPAQAGAIRLWVANGGKLLIGGGSQVTASVKGLEEILPVQLNGNTVSVNDLSSLSLWSTPPKGPVEISQSVLKTGSEALAKSGEEILLAQRNLDQGKVIYAGYDLFIAPMESWAGNQYLWTQQLLFTNMEMNHFGPPDQLFGDLWGLQSALKQVPHFLMPKLSHLVMVFAIYLVVVGPVMYLIFARLKKHEWNWLAVPLAGLLVAMGLFIYGNHLRGNAVLVHNLGYVHVDASGVASVRGAAAIVSQEADDYELNVQEGFAWPLDLDGISPRSSREEKRISFQNGSSVLFQDVPQWSKRDVYIETAQQIGGNLSATITYQNNQWVGKVTNSTRLGLKEVEVIIGNRRIPIGTLAAGQSKDFHVESLATLHSRLEPHTMNLPNRQQEMFFQMMNSNMKFTPISNLDVIGWTEDSLINLSVKDRQIKTANLYLINGSMSIVADARGKIYLPYGSIRPVVIDSAHPTFEDPFADMISMDNSGTITFEYHLGSSKLKKIDSMSVQQNGNGLTEIYHWQKQVWQPVTALNNQNALSYISPDGRVRVRAEVPAHQMIKKPLIELTGTVK